MNIDNVISKRNINTLNIVSGMVLKEKISNNFNIMDQTIVSFNEAMVQGKSDSEIFSSEFFRKRISSLETDYKTYKRLVIDELSPLIDKQFENIVLWFDKDMFCQINMITILAYLKQKNNQTTIYFCCVNEITSRVNFYKQINLDKMDDLYKNVIINQQSFKTGYPTIDNGVEFYLDYLKDDNIIYDHIKKHLNDNDLIEQLIDKFRDFGLGNTQYKIMIKRFKLCYNKV
jgi:hypothetical protein